MVDWVCYRFVIAIEGRGCVLGSVIRKTEIGSCVISNQLIGGT